MREVGLCRTWTVNPLSHRRGKAYSFRDAGGLEDLVAEDEESTLLIHLFDGTGMSFALENSLYFSPSADSLSKLEILFSLSLASDLNTQHTLNTS